MDICKFRAVASAAAMLFAATFSLHASAGVASNGQRMPSAAPAGAAMRAADPGVIPIQARPYGKSYSEWAIVWWKWALEIPARRHPLLDSALCNEWQSGRVWFLGGTLTGDGRPVFRSCTIPPGKALFFPLISSAWFSFLNDPPEFRTEEFVRAFTECTDARLDVTIDGTKLATPTRYLERSYSHDIIQLPVDNVFGLPESVVPELKLTDYGDFGYYLFLPPLPVGTHHIQWTAQMTCTWGGDTPFNLYQNIGYHITVSPN
jgi:hypothetical protein